MERKKAITVTKKFSFIGYCKEVFELFMKVAKTGAVALIKNGKVIPKLLIGTSELERISLERHVKRFFELDRERKVSDSVWISDSQRTAAFLPLVELSTNDEYWLGASLLGSEQMVRQFSRVLMNKLPHSKRKIKQGRINEPSANFKILMAFNQISHKLQLPPSVERRYVRIISRITPKKEQASWLLFVLVLILSFNRNLQIQRAEQGLTLRFQRQASSERERNALYREFLKKIEGPFSAFVQSDKVNTYLQTVGMEVKSKDFHNGIPYEFLVVTGYEEERGRWATAYDNQIRFGDEIIPTQIIKAYGIMRGFRRALLLTPNFFYGRNHIGEEIEYRMGLIKTEAGLEVRPVILRRREIQIITRVLEDLCVVHRGLSINLRTAEKLGKAKVTKITAVQQFLSCFWNIDDYLRKQNPNLASDFDIDAWKVVEVFSGRIILQMLIRIADLLSQKFFELDDIRSWIIPQAEEIYCQSLTSRIEQCLDGGTMISENQLKTLVKDFILYLSRFRNFQPLSHLLLKTGSAVIPAMIDCIHDPSVRGAAFSVLRFISKKFPSLVGPDLDGEKTLPLTEGAARNARKRLKKKIDRWKNDGTTEALLQKTSAHFVHLLKDAAFIRFLLEEELLTIHALYKNMLENIRSSIQPVIEETLSGGVVSNDDLSPNALKVIRYATNTSCELPDFLQGIHDDLKGKGQSFILLDDPGFLWGVVLRAVLRLDMKGFALLRMNMQDTH